jgi:hypothetical protein
MNKLALLAAILFTLVTGKSADASSLFDFSYVYNPYDDFGLPPFLASGQLVLDGSGNVISASGYAGGTTYLPLSPISTAAGSYVSPTSFGLFFTTPLYVSISISTYVPPVYGGNPYLTSLLQNENAFATVFQQATMLSSGLSAFSHGTLTVSPVLSPVPLPASAPLFGLALLGLAGIGFASKRLSLARSIRICSQLQSAGSP